MAGAKERQVKARPFAEQYSGIAAWLPHVPSELDVAAMASARSAANRIWERIKVAQDSYLPLAIAADGQVKLELAPVPAKPEPVREVKAGRFKAGDHVRVKAGYYIGCTGYAESYFDDHVCVHFDDGSGGWLFFKQDRLELVEAAP